MRKFLKKFGRNFVLLPRKFEKIEGIKKKFSIIVENSLKILCCFQCNSEDSWEKLWKDILEQFQRAF